MSRTLTESELTCFQILYLFSDSPHTFVSNKLPTTQIAMVWRSRNTRKEARTPTPHLLNSIKPSSRTSAQPKTHRHVKHPSVASCYSLVSFRIRTAWIDSKQRMHFTCLWSHLCLAPRPNIRAARRASVGPKQQTRYTSIFSTPTTEGKPEEEAEREEEKRRIAFEKPVTKLTALPITD